jgi:hypothetical protein
MVTVSHIVKKIVDERIYLQEAISHNIVSNTLLAKKLKPEIEKELQKPVNTSSIIMSLRRIQEKLMKSTSTSFFEYFTEIDMKTNICYIIVRSNQYIKSNLLKIYNLVNFREGDILNVIQGNYLNGIVTNERYKEDITKLFDEKDILYVLENLVQFSLLNKETYLYTPGFFYNVFRIISWDNINILTVFDTPKDFIIIVDEKDSIRCLKTLEKLMHKKDNY